MDGRSLPIISEQIKKLLLKKIKCCCMPAVCHTFCKHAVASANVCCCFYFRVLKNKVRTFSNVSKSFGKKNFFCIFFSRLHNFPEILRHDDEQLKLHLLDLLNKRKVFLLDNISFGGSSIQISCRKANDSRRPGRRSGPRKWRYLRTESEHGLTSETLYYGASRVKLPVIISLFLIMNMAP